MVWIHGAPEYPPVTLRSISGLFHPSFGGGDKHAVAVDGSAAVVWLSRERVLLLWTRRDAPFASLPPPTEDSLFGNEDYAARRSLKNY
ncbi:unnamed protein product, partial [Amoebophrya sp. A25]|eukprot:GSA25T00000073001.1